MDSLSAATLWLLTLITGAMIKKNTASGPVMRFGSLQSQNHLYFFGKKSREMEQHIGFPVKIP
jgi:hypothetical protein